MTLVRKRPNSDRFEKTNPPATPPDWSALMPVLPGEGPRSRELYAALRRLIETGILPPGAKLPTTRDLSARLAVSRTAAVAAFEMLVGDGFAEARVGAGTFVAAQVPRLASPATAPRPAERPAPQAPGALACTLGVAAADDRTFRIFRTLLSRRLARPGPEHFSYGDPQGGIELREAIAAYLRTARGVRCHAGQIMVTSGTQQGLDLVLRTVIAPGDPVWIEDPCYPMARASFAGAGARLVGVPIDAEGLDPARGEKLCAKARAVYVTPSHQFPLGVTMTMRRRVALIDWARRNGAWIIEDDYDSEFRYAGPPLTALQGMDDSGRVAYLGTFSKVLFPGLRTGYAVVPDALMPNLLALRARTDRTPPTLAEGALADLLNEGHFAAHLRRARRRAEASRDALVESLRRVAGGSFDLDRPSQGLHLVARLAPARSDVAIVDAARKAGIGGRALSPMYVDAPPLQGLVLGFAGFGDAALRDAAATLGRLAG